LLLTIKKKAKHIIAQDAIIAQEEIVAKKRLCLGGNRTDLKKVQHVIVVDLMLLAEHRF